MKMGQWWAFFVVTLSLVFTELKGETGTRQRGRDVRNIQKSAVEAWGASLVPETDYNATRWKMKLAQPQYVFDYYVRRLSDLFLDKGATVNFALVGACDGTNDNTIRERYLPSEHWRAIFVEPISLNVADLKKFLEEHGVTNRSYVLQAAVTNQCNSSTIIVKTPDKAYMQDTTKAHWMRRQIGGIVPIRPDGKPRLPTGWKAESVRCMRGSEVTKEWAEVVSRRPAGKRRKPAKSNIKRRPHILKIDAEGFDYQVLSSFLLNDTTNAELPLLINYEAKTMFANYPLAVEALERRGYVVSEFASDGFAMLKKDFMFRSRKKKDKV